jgi:urease accessory protein
LTPDQRSGQSTDGRPGWRAELSLRFSDDGAGGTRLERAHSGPLVVQRPFYPEGRALPHVYLLHPPGGLVGGDQLHVDVAVAAGAHALVTTPAATKVYRTRGPTAEQTQRLTVAAGGALEWLPQAMILHDGSASALSTEVRLDAGARFIGVDTLCFGLPARGETFAVGRCRQRFELWRQNESQPHARPLVIERACFDATDAVHAAPWGLDRARVHALFVASPAPDQATLATLLPLLRAAAERVAAPERAGVTVVADGEALIGRYLGASTERAQRFVQELWTLLRPPLMRRPALPPRIWAT